MSGEAKRFSLDGLSVAFLAGAVLFSVLALLNAFGTTLYAFDLETAKVLHRVALEDPIITSFLAGVTALGDGVALTALTVLVVACLVAKKQRLFAFGLALSMIGVGILNLSLKLAFRRPRPAFVDPISVSNGWSFPSGHSMGTLVAFGMLTYIAFEWVEHPTRRRILLAGATLWVVAMGFSRIYLGVHYFSDVVGGLACGVAWLAVSIKAIDRAKRSVKSDTELVEQE